MRTGWIWHVLCHLLAVLALCCKSRWERRAAFLSFSEMGHVCTLITDWAAGVLAPAAI